MGDTRFISFIFNDNDNDQSKKQWEDAYASFKGNPSQISDFLGNRELSGSFIAGFEVYGVRIARFVQLIPRYGNPKAPKKDKEELDLQLGKLLGGHAIKKIIIPLLEQRYQHLHTRDALLELLFSTVALADRSIFDQLAARLGNAPALLGRLISDERSENLRADWIDCIRSNKEAVQGWIKVSVDLVEKCEGDHNVSSEMDRWELLTTLELELRQAYNLGSHSQRKYSVGTVQTGSRASDSNESLGIKGRRASYTPAAIEPGISQKCITLLRQLGITIPSNARAIRDTIVHIETNEAIPILEAVLKSFPCRLCFRRGYGNISEAIFSPICTNFETEEQRLDSDSFEGLLGGGLGVWKIALSSQALKDLKHAQREGYIDHIKSKLEALASGDWVRGAVSGDVSKNHGGHRFRVPVHKAFYGGNGRILWQVDVGFDEKHIADSQIVRVWRIGDVKEIQNSLDSVYRAQKGFSQTRVEHCKINLIDKQKKIKIPMVFDVINQKEKDKRESIDERLPEDMLISGKFHTLTGNVLESIIRGQSHSDFPFDVTGKEVEIIKHKNATFILGRSGTGKTSCLIYKLMSRYLARNIAQPETPIRQILLTRSEPLARKLESEVHLLIDTQLLRVKAEFNYLGDGAEISLQVRDGMEEDTTQDFFSLQQENFPFVCTFGHFLNRLENTIRGNDRKTVATSKSRRLVDYVVFKESYWPWVSQGSNRGGLEPDLVFAEIMGVIKGAASLLTGLKPLSKEEYRATSARLAPTFAMTSERDTVYRIFESYENRKANNGDYDGIDRVRTIIGELNENISLRRRLESIFEEVYVDEVQDQRPLEIELLLNLVQNPRGIHFAGDSAQCISKDSTFRFANLKALFFNYYSERRFTRIDPSAAKPELFSLSRNFRSHQGILSLASFVMELLWKGFPDMVDKLPPEIGDCLGPKPVIFIGSDLVKFLQMASKRTDAVENSVSGSPQDGSPTKQVSSQQIIIIRDHQGQEELQTQLGDGSLVFTVLQSKGMEYDDVFLYNLFSSSPCLRAFQTLQELLVPGANPSYGAIHMNMCSELKSLYVAITRPRNRLWILESDPGFIPELFTQKVPKPLVEIKPFQPEEILFMMKDVRPTNRTTEREWIETGDQCMDRGLFEQALRCYNNAYDGQKITLATASIAEQKGKACQARGDGTPHSYFKDASVGFLELNMKERAATCLEAHGDWAAAAHLYRERGKYEKAAGLFEKARMYGEAAGQYHLCGKTLSALQSLHRGKLYERLVEDVSRYRHKIRDGDRMSYARECNMLLRRKPPHIRSSLWELTFNMFNSDLEKEEFLLEFEHKLELLKFYLERGRLRDAFFYSTKTGEMDTALNLMIDWAKTNGDVYVWELRELEEIFSHSEAGRVLTHISTASATYVDLSCKERFLGMSPQWEDVATVAGQYFKAGNRLDRGSIKQEWTRDYMDTTVSINIPYFLKLKADFDLGDFPLDYISGLQETVKEVKSGDRKFSKATLCALGLLYNPDKSKPYITLKWSPLLRSAGRTNMLESEMLEAVLNYLSGQISSACSLIQERALGSWNSLLQQETCRSCVTQVGWDRPEKVEIRKCLHTSIPRVRFERSMQGLLSIIASFIKLPTYFTLQDELLNILFTKLTYRSSFFESAGEIARVRDWLRTPKASGVLDKLQDRFLHRWAVTIHLHIGSKYDFVSLLGNYQPAKCIGLGQSVLNDASTSRPFAVMLENTQGDRKLEEVPRGRDGIWGALARLGGRGKNRPRAPERPQDLVYHTLIQYHFLHRWEDSSERTSVGRMSEKMDSLLQSLSDLSNFTQCMSFYHESVITIYEEMLTFLIFSIKKTDVVIPESWVELHLSQWETSLKTCTDTEQFCYKRLLLRVTSSFCDWVIKLESSSQGSKLGESRILARRSVNLLVVSLINIGTAGAFAAGYQEVWLKVQKVFSFRALGTASILRVLPKDLVKPLTRALKHYNDKDGVLIYVREGRISRRGEAWRGAGSLFRSMPIRQIPLDRRMGSKIDSIYLIQAWYRRQKANLERRNSHMRAPIGQGVKHLYNLCKSHKTEFSSRQMFLEFTTVMMIEGLDLYLAVNVLLSQIRGMKKIRVERKFAETANREITSYETKAQVWSAMFSLDVPLAFSLDASACRRRLEKERSICREFGEKAPGFMRWLQKPFSAPAPAQTKFPAKDQPKPAAQTNSSSSGSSSNQGKSTAGN